MHLVCPNLLPHCLLWHLHLTSTSLPSPPPLPLVASHSCSPWLVVVLSLVNLQLCDCHPPLPLPPMVGCCIFHPLRCLSSLLHGLSSPCATVSCSTSLGPLGWLVVASPPSCPAGCCIAFPQATTYHLPETLPFIAPLHLIIPLSMPLPLAPLVQLVVVLPLLMLPPLICWHLCLSLCHGLPCL